MSSQVKVVLSIPEAELESLRAFLQYSDGEVTSVSKVRKRKRKVTEEAEDMSENSSAPAENPQVQEPSTPYALGSLGGATADQPCCNYCLQLPCTVLSLSNPSFLSAYGQPRPQNITKRYKDYRYYYTALKKNGLWHNEEYLRRKDELGIFIDDVREVLPNCVVSDVRKGGRIPQRFPTRDISQSWEIIKKCS